MITTFVRYPIPVSHHDPDASVDEPDATLRRREIAAGFAHLDRLAVSGTIWTFPKRDRWYWSLVAMVSAVICGAGLIAWVALL